MWLTIAVYNILKISSVTFRRTLIPYYIYRKSLSLMHFRIALGSQASYDLSLPLSLPTDEPPALVEILVISP